jgi:hypothetical protein
LNCVKVVDGDPKEKATLEYFDKEANGQMKHYVTKSQNVAGTMLYSTVVVGLYIKFYWMTLPIHSNDRPARDDIPPLHFLKDGAAVQEWFRDCQKFHRYPAHASTSSSSYPSAYPIRSATSQQSSSAPAWTATKADSPAPEGPPDAVEVRVMYNTKEGTYSFSYPEEVNALCSLLRSH